MVAQYVDRVVEDQDIEFREIEPLGFIASNRVDVEDVVARVL